LSRSSAATPRAIPEPNPFRTDPWEPTNPFRPSAGRQISRSGQMICSLDSAAMPDALPVAIADTSALIAFFNAADNHHKSVRAGIGEVGHLVVSPCVLTCARSLGLHQRSCCHRPMGGSPYRPQPRGRTCAARRLSPYRACGCHERCPRQGIPHGRHSDARLPASPRRRASSRLTGVGRQLGGASARRRGFQPGRGTLARSRCVYSCCGLSSTSPVWPCSTIWPFHRTSTCSASCRTTARS
jgi:hypothetical protein